MSHSLLSKPFFLPNLHFPNVFFCYLGSILLNTFLSIEDPHSFYMPIQFQSSWIYSFDFSLFDIPINAYYKFDLKPRSDNSVNSCLLMFPQVYIAFYQTLQTNIPQNISCSKLVFCFTSRNIMYNCMHICLDGLDMYYVGKR